MTKIAAALAAGRARLAGVGGTTAALDARLLLGAAAGMDTTTLLAEPEHVLSSEAEEKFAALLARRAGGEPVARILGVKEFWGLPFQLNAATIDPRPDTETLVEAALAEARLGFAGRPLHICDLGTGTGAILIALLTELPGARGTAVDISQDAVHMARRNAQRLGVAARISFHVGDFSVSPGGPFDMVVSNPPYVRTSDLAALAREVRVHDPHAALDGGEDGLAAYRAIASRAEELLAPGGVLVFEIGCGQERAVAGICASGGLAVRRSVADLGGVTRVIVAGRTA